MTGEYRINFVGTVTAQVRRVGEAESEQSAPRQRRTLDDLSERELASVRDKALRLAQRCERRIAQIVRARVRADAKKRAAKTARQVEHMKRQYTSTSEGDS